MSGSIFGKHFTVTTWGESHGPAIGAVIDGCPAGVKLDQELIQRDLDRRRPGQSRYATPRSEADQVQILSGVFFGYTTGTPVSILIANQDQKPSDYDYLSAVFRPGHADYPYQQKYGIRDYRGGGRASGRETAARVAAGAVAKQLLAEFQIEITAYTYAIGAIEINPNRFTPGLIISHPLAMPDPEAAAQASQFLDRMAEEKNSVGGVVACTVTGMPAGLGEPVFEKLDAMLAKALFSIGAVKAVEIGSGIQAARMLGSEHNDWYQYQDDGTLLKKTNHAGGILGGISDGSPLKLKAYFKPTPSIGQEQRSVNTSQENISFAITGRHDPVIVPRAVVVVEAMVALTLADYLLIGATSQVANLRRLYKG